MSVRICVKRVQAVHCNKTQEPNPDYDTVLKTKTLCCKFIHVKLSSGKIYTKISCLYGAQMLVPSTYDFLLEMTFARSILR